MIRVIVLALALPVALAAQQGADTAAARSLVDTTGLRPTDTTARPIHLDEAVRLAEANSPLAIQAQGQTESSRGQVRAAYAAFIPSVLLNASMTRQGGDRFDPQGNLVPYTGDAWQYGNGLQLNVDLFDGGSRIFNIRTYKAQVNAAEANEVEQKYAVALSVKQQFFAVLAAREAESAAKSQLAEANEQLKQSLAKIHAKEATKSDSLRAVIQVGNAQLAILTARQDIDNASAALTRLVGTPYSITASADDTLQFAFAEVDSAALHAMATVGPAVKQAQASDVAAAAASKAARAPYLPTLTAGWSLNGNGSTENIAFAADRYAYQNQFRIGLSYPLFNQFQREQSIVQADVARRNAEATLRDTQLAAQQNFVQYLGALRTGQAQVEINQTSVAAAEEDLRVQQQRYQYGASTLLDVLTSEAALITARVSLIQARYNYRVAKAQLEALVGRDL